MLSLPAATSRKKPITISCSSSFEPSTSACTSTLVRSSVGRSRRSAIIVWQREKISGISLSTMLCMPSGAISGSPALSDVCISRAQIASSSSGIPMKLPITRETARWATSVTRSHESRPSRRSSTFVTILRIAGSWAAIRRGVKPA